jgi:hypothetical protein
MFSAAVGVLLGQQHRGAGLVDALDHLEHLLDHQRRQAQRGLVEQQRFGPAHQRAADGHHLLLAAGQRAGGVVLLAPHAGWGRARTLPPASFWMPALSRRCT